MPFYTFKCPSCKKEKEVLQAMNDPAPICDGVEMERLWAGVRTPGIKYNCSGFYETDYKDRQGDFKVLKDVGDSESKDAGVTAKKVKYKGPPGKSFGNSK